MNGASDSTRCTQPGRNPVLLIHGISDTIAVFSKMAPYLSRLGWSVHNFNMIPNNGDCCLDLLAKQVADYVAQTFDPKQPIDIVGFSMGGIVSRYYIQRLGGAERVQRFVSISAPNNGTLTGYLSGRPGCVQMRPDSAFLQDLNRDAIDILGRLNFTVIWTPYDLMIVPSNSSQMRVGKEVTVPVRLHSWMLTDDRSLNAIVTALSEPMLANSRQSLRL
ncbi:triacylglycerol lipase [Allocoleopsis sp.]|uniref:esterase/lipase family protein n=1 Tax=Allocoleopsis sp. TaxID=3088169 RepID=UPI002FD0B67D